MTTNNSKQVPAGAIPQEEPVAGASGVTPPPPPAKAMFSAAKGGTYDGSVSIRTGLDTFKKMVQDIAVTQAATMDPNTGTSNEATTLATQLNTYNKMVGANAAFFTRVREIRRSAKTLGREDLTAEIDGILPENMNQQFMVRSGGRDTSSNYTSKSTVSGQMTTGGVKDGVTAQVMAKRARGLPLDNVNDALLVGLHDAFVAKATLDPTAPDPAGDLQRQRGRRESAFANGGRAAAMELVPSWEALTGKPLAEAPISYGLLANAADAMLTMSKGNGYAEGVEPYQKNLKKVNAAYPDMSASEKFALATKIGSLEGATLTKEPALSDFFWRIQEAATDKRPATVAQLSESVLTSATFIAGNLGPVIKAAGIDSQDNPGLVRDLKLVVAEGNALNRGLIDRDTAFGRETKERLDRVNAWNAARESQLEIMASSKRTVSSVFELAESVREQAGLYNSTELPTEKSVDAVEKIFRVKLPGGAASLEYAQAIYGISQPLEEVGLGAFKDFVPTNEDGSLSTSRAAWSKKLKEDEKLYKDAIKDNPDAGRTGSVIAVGDVFFSMEQLKARSARLKELRIEVAQGLSSTKLREPGEFQGSDAILPIHRTKLQKEDLKNVSLDQISRMMVFLPVSITAKDTKQLEALRTGTSELTPRQKAQGIQTLNIINDAINGDNHSRLDPALVNNHKQLSDLIYSINRNIPVRTQDPQDVYAKSLQGLLSSRGGDSVKAVLRADPRNAGKTEDDLDAMVLQLSTE